MEEQNQPLVSIAIALYNKEESIYRTLKSLQNQTYKNFECIIVDDHSTDNGPNIVYNCFCKNDKRFKLLMNTTSEKYVDAHNQSYEMCKGKYLFRIDADDIFFKDYIEFNVKYMDEHPDYDAICTYSEFKSLDENGLFEDDTNEIVKNAYSQEELKKFINYPICSMLGNTIIWSNPTSCIRASFYNSHHPKYSFYAMGDYIFWLNTLANGAKLYVVDTIKSYRCNYSNSNDIKVSADKNFYTLTPRLSFVLNTYKWQALQIAKDRDNFLVDDLINEYKKKADDAFKQMVEQDDPDNRKRQDYA